MRSEILSPHRQSDCVWYLQRQVQGDLQSVMLQERKCCSDSIKVFWINNCAVTIIFALNKIVIYHSIKSSYLSCYSFVNDLKKKSSQLILYPTVIKAFLKLRAGCYRGILDYWMLWWLFRSEVKLLCVSLNFESISIRSITIFWAIWLILTSTPTNFCEQTFIGAIKVMILIGRVITQEHNGANKKAGDKKSFVIIPNNRGESLDFIGLMFIWTDQSSCARVKNLWDLWLVSF